MAPFNAIAPNKSKMKRFPAEAVFDTLYRALGPQHWWPGRTPLEVMIGAVLTQHTSWANVERAMACLRRRRALSAHQLAQMPRNTLATLIRSAGYPRVKAQRVQALARWLMKSTGGRLSHLRREDTIRLRTDLLLVRGIGPETADSILLYALHRPVFVVDAYTRRFLLRHEWIQRREQYDQIAGRFTAALPRDTRLYNEYHALVVALGKRWCRPVPRCSDCPLRDWLPRRWKMRVEHQ